MPEPGVSDVWAELREAWGAGAGRLPAGRALRLTLRSADGGELLVVEPEEDGRSGTPPDGEGARSLVDEVEGLLSVWWRPRRREAPVLLAGASEAWDTWEGRPVPVGPTAFLQVNREQGARLHDAALRALAAPGGPAGASAVDEPAGGRGRGDDRGRPTDPVRDGRVLDGYCGVGQYGRRLAAHGATVIGIELDPRAAAAARQDAPEGFTVLEGRVEDRIDEALPVDASILNPPRTGLHESLPAVLRERGPGRIVYVSCDPPTLARDLGRLDGVYELRGLAAFDLFPQTAHVETVATLERTTRGAAGGESPANGGVPNASDRSG